MYNILQMSGEERAEVTSSDFWIESLFSSYLHDKPAIVTIHYNDYFPRREVSALTHKMFAASAKLGYVRFKLYYAAQSPHAL